MALTRTTLSAACAVDATSITVAAAGTLAVGMQIRIDGEDLIVTKGYVAASTSVPVLRGQNGTVSQAHPATAGVVYGSVSDSEWGTQPAGIPIQFPLAGRRVICESYSASGAITLPPPGADLRVILNGTAALAMTVAAPGKALDFCQLTIIANGAAAHTVTFTGGLSGAGTSYDVWTSNATAPSGVEAFAANSLWISPTRPGMGGTLTNIIGTLA